MRKELVILVIIAMALVGMAGATMMTGTMSVSSSKVTFANNIRFDHEFRFFCTECMQYTNISDTDIAMANALISKTGGLPLISCSHCGKVYVLPEQTLRAGENDDWIECIPLGGMAAVEPLGRLEIPTGSGLFKYSTGGLGPVQDGYDRPEYMAITGWDPVVLLKLMK